MARSCASRRVDSDPKPWASYDGCDRRSRAATTPLPKRCSSISISASRTTSPTGSTRRKRDGRRCGSSATRRRCANRPAMPIRCAGSATSPPISATVSARSRATPRSRSWRSRRSRWASAPIPRSLPRRPASCSARCPTTIRRRSSACRSYTRTPCRPCATTFSATSPSRPGAPASQTIEGMAGYTQRAYTVTGRGDADQLEGAVLAPEIFGILRLTPAAGRFFLPEEAISGASLCGRPRARLLAAAVRRARRRRRPVNHARWATARHRRRRAGRLLVSGTRSPLCHAVRSAAAADHSRHQAGRQRVLGYRPASARA